MSACALRGSWKDAGESSGGGGGALETKALNARAQGLDSVLEKGRTMAVARQGHDKVKSLHYCCDRGQEGRG